MQRRTRRARMDDIDTERAFGKMGNRWASAALPACIPVGLFQGSGPGSSQSFHQPVLQGAEAAFDSPFGLRRVRRDPLDTRFPEMPGPSESRSSAPALPLSSPEPSRSSRGRHCTWQALQTKRETGALSLPNRASHVTGRVSLRPMVLPQRGQAGSVVCAV